MNEPVKVLYFVDRMLRGGIQSLVIDWISRFDKNKIHVDFLLLDDGKKYELEETLKRFGCKVYKLEGIWIKNPIDYIKQAKALDNFFNEHHEYKVVHMHSSSKNFLVLKYAKKYNIPTRIAHAHALDFQCGSFTKKIVGNLLKPRLINYSTDYFACSKSAGKWLFGENIINNSKFEVVKNGVDYNRFKYNINNRNSIRHNYNIKDTDILIGHVGRFTKVKNHSFMIDILYKLLEENKNYKLMFIGEGILEKKIKEKIIRLDIKDNIIFAGYQQDVSMYLSALDIFIMPSLYEGLGLGLIEAQANGLPCLATKNTIPKDVKISNNFNFINLELKEWLESIKNIDLARQDNFDALKDAGYIIDDSIVFLEKKYLNIK